jgi:hypothetical protein
MESISIPPGVCIMVHKIENTKYLLANLTPCSRFLLQEVTGSQVVTKFPGVYGR